MRRINAFTGHADGTAITLAGSTIGGNPFDTVFTSNGATANYSTTSPGGGDVSAVVASTSTAGSARFGWDVIFGSVPLVYGVAYVYLPSLPATDWRFVQHLANGTSCSTLVITTAGQVQVTDVNGARASGNRSTTVLPLNTLVRIEWRIELNGAGQATVRLFTNAASTTPTETIVGPIVSYGGPANQHYFGIPSPVANIGPHYLSAVGVSDTDWLGPDLVAPNTVPTISLFAPFRQYAWGDQVSLTATVTDPDLNATHTTAWSLTAKPSDSTLTIGSTLDSATFEPDRPGAYTVRATVTDDLGATAYAEASFAVAAAVYLKVAGAEVPARIYGAVITARVGSGLVGTSTITA